jgi:hypothetical protein
MKIVNSIDVREVLDGNICLFIVNEIDDSIQKCFQNVLGTTTLWDHEYITIGQGVKLWY